MFDHKKPCNNCPFRRSQAKKYNLGKERITEIVNATAFECHKTTGVAASKKPPQQCAGLMALLHSANKPNQIMQVAQRLTNYDPATIDKTDTYATIEEAIKDHE